MNSFVKNLALLGSAFTLVSAMPAVFELEPRAVCNADLCLRGLRATQRDPAPASAYCSSIGVTATTTQTIKQYATTTTQLPVQVITVDKTTVTSGVVCYTTTTGTETLYLKRAVPTTTAIAAILSASCGPSPVLSSRISSACSCFMTGAATTTTTETETITLAPPPPITQTGPYTTTVTVETCSETSTVVLPNQVPGLCNVMPNPFAPSATSPGVKYDTNCNWQWFGGVEYTLSTTIQPTFASCIRLCSTIAGCAAVNYQRHAPNYGTCWTYNADMPQGNAGYEQGSFDSAALV